MQGLATRLFGGARGLLRGALAGRARALLEGRVSGAGSTAAPAISGAGFWVGRTMGLGGNRVLGGQRAPGDVGGVEGESEGKELEKGGYKKWREQICHVGRRVGVDYRQN